MRYRLPDGCGGVILAGVRLSKVAKGVVEADTAAADRLAPHGIRPFDGPRDAGPAGVVASKKRAKP